MHRFFVEPEQIKDQEIQIIGSDVHHIARVLRLKLGDALLICDGQGYDYYCIIDFIDVESITLSVQNRAASSSELKTKVVLFQGIPKGDKMELIIQKCVELGVYEIVPVSMKRCVSIINHKNEHKKLKRWQEIAESAAKQSMRSIIPIIKPPMSFDQAVAYGKELDLILTAYEDADGFGKTRQLMNGLNQYQTIGLFIGPEGGFDKNEITMLELVQSKVITLGKRILRTETAGLAAMAIMMFHLEEE